MSEWHTGWTEGYASARSEAQAEIEKLRAALKPFADAAAYIIPGIDDSQTVSEWEFTAGELRAAEKLYYGSE